MEAVRAVSYYGPTSARIPRTDFSASGGGGSKL